MQYQTAQLRDFLTVYNTMSETCFSHCIHTLNSRKLDDDEVKCVDSCIGKFVRFNHRVMQLYATMQGDLMQKRMKEMEEEAAKAAANVEPPKPVESIEPVTNNQNTETVDVKS